MEPKTPKPVSEYSNPNSQTGSTRKPSKSPVIKEPKTPKPVSENSNPNSQTGSTRKPSKSPVIKKPVPVFESPKRKLRERKFVVAKKKNKGQKCLSVAYENLRASQEEFFKSRDEPDEIEKKLGMHELVEGYNGNSENVEIGGLVVKRTREEVRTSIPEVGKVMSLVHAFENNLSIRNDDENENPDPDSEVKRPFSPPKGGELVMTSENLGLNNASVSASWDSSQGSISSRTSNGSRGNRRHSTDSTGAKVGRRLKKKQPRVTSLRPFQLRTEQRGKMKEEEFVKKLQEMMMEQERQRVPVAQGLPWTTDEPECLLKPPVKESTMPVDLKLHTDVRAVERAEFDHQVAEKMCLIEQYKKERERQRMLEEEEEIRRLRKELVPKAQPLPYFDRPFIPKRGTKLPTIPKEPKFHIPEHKKIKCCLSWNDSFSFYQ